MNNLLKIKSLVFAALCAVATTAAHAAPPVFLTIDRSSATLISEADAKAVWQAQIKKTGPLHLAKLYPPAKWGYLSQVEGGYNSAKICVVTARAALMRRTGKTVEFKPEKMATAFDAVPNLPQDQCQALAKAKLEEAVAAVMTSLIAPR